MWHGASQDWTLFPSYTHLSFPLRLWVWKSSLTDYDNVRCRPLRSDTPSSLSSARARSRFWDARHLLRFRRLSPKKVVSSVRAMLLLYPNSDLCVPVSKSCCYRGTREAFVQATPVFPAVFPYNNNIPSPKFGCGSFPTRRITKKIGSTSIWNVDVIVNTVCARKNRYVAKEIADTPYQTFTYTFSPSSIILLFELPPET